MLVNIIVCGEFRKSRELRWSWQVRVADDRSPLMDLLTEHTQPRQATRTMLGLTKRMARPNPMTKLDAHDLSIPCPGLLRHIGTVPCMPVEVPERT